MKEKIVISYTEDTVSRLDIVLLNYLAEDPDFADITRSQIKQWIGMGRVKIDRQIVKKAGSQLKNGAVVEVDPPEIEVSCLEPYQFELDILYEDQSLIVINKCSGLSMHPGAGNKKETLANAVLWHLGAREKQQPELERLGIVHRLDKDTTGIVVVAKTAGAHSKLSRQFAEKTASRLYQALVYVTPRAKRAVQREEQGVIETQIGRDPKHRKKMAVLEQGGKTALTRWRKIDQLSYAVHLNLELGTGRTHQIRVHMDHISSPVLGDKTYGNFTGLPKELIRACNLLGRQALHAAKLEFDHPETSKRMSFNSAPPDDFNELMESFRNYDKILSVN